MSSINKYIVEAVRKHPYLYQKSHPRYRDVTLKNEQWEAIASELGLTALEVIKKWKNLRDRFKRVQRAAQEQPSGPHNSRGPTSRPWALYPVLASFLDEMQDGCIQVSTYTPAADMEEVDEKHSAGDEVDEAFEEYIDCPSVLAQDDRESLVRRGQSPELPSSSATVEAGPARDGESMDESALMAVITEALQMLKSLHQPQPDQHPAITFGLFLGHRIKRLSTCGQHSAYSRLNELLTQIEKEYEEKGAFK